jgi:alpha-ribazole phosphatase
MPAHAAFNEQHLGDWQGQHRDTFRQENGITAMDFWMTKGDARAPGPDGESYPDLVARVVPLIESLNAAHSGRDIITVTHGGTIRAALGMTLGGPPAIAHAFTIDNCSISIIEHLHRKDRPEKESSTSGVWRLGGVNLRPWLAAGAI